MRLTAKAEQWRDVALKHALTPAGWRAVLAAAEGIAASRGARQVGAVHLFMALADLAGPVYPAELPAERPEFPTYVGYDGQEHGEY